MRAESEKSTSFLILSRGMYEFFIANGKEGIEAMILYQHLHYTALLQKTNQVWACEEYLKKGLSMGSNRIKRAKSFLKKHGLISYIQRQNLEQGRFEKTFIKLNYIYIKKTKDKILSGFEFYENEALTDDFSRWHENHPSGSQNRTTGNKQQILKMNNINTLNKKDILVSEIVDYLNIKTNSKFKANTKSTRMHIEARLDEGFSLEDFKSVIDIKTEEWLNNPKMQQYLRPVTLFGSKFESYLNQKRTAAVEKENENYCKNCGTELFNGECLRCRKKDISNVQ